MTEKQIQLLGFKATYDDGGGTWEKYHYYTYKIANGFEFITNASDEIVNGDEWFIEFFDSDPTIRFTEFGEVQALINLIENRIVK
jgi:hypothetical protein